MVIVSGVAVNLLMDALTGLICGIRTNIRVIVFADVMTAFEFPMSDPLENFRSFAASDCRSMAASDCFGVLQACMPSCHV